MEKRIDYATVSPEAYQLMLQFEKYCKRVGFDKKLIELIKIRVSQINGCGYCLDMHTKVARMYGETEQRIYCLSVWRESPFYTEEERIVLELAEAVTEIGKHGVSDDLYHRVRKVYNEKQYVDLIYIMNTINSWNRISIAMNMVPGSYQPVTDK